jgi:hypothetical protein
VSAAPVLWGEAAGEAAATQTVTLTVIEGGAAAAGETAVAGEAVVAGEAAAAGAAAFGTGAIIATAGIGLLVIGAVALGVYLYKNSQKAPSKPKLVGGCPLGPQPVPVPNVAPKPVPVPQDDRIPEAAKRRIVARKEQERQQRCPELWESIQKKANRQRKIKGAGQQGMKFRYWDNICSENDPSTPEGSRIWDEHQQAYENDRRSLQNDIDEFEEKCDGDLPDGAKEYAGKAFPDKSEWRGNSPQCVQYRLERQQRYARYLGDPTAVND